MGKDLNKTREERLKLKSSAARLSVISNCILVILKIVVGLLIGSVAILSEAIHSGIDLIAAALAFFSVRIAGKPADEDHSFGHGKVENISGTVEALLIFVAAAWIISEAMKKLSNPEPLEAAGLGVGVMLFSAVVNILVSNRLFDIGRITESVALQADAWHLRTDVYTSAGVMASLGIIWIGSLVVPGVDLRYLDPLAAIVVAILIMRAAWNLTVHSARDLMDVSLPEEERSLICEHITAFAPQVRGYHGLRTRRSGAFRFAEFHVVVDARMSVDESHSLAEVMTSAIREHYPCSLVTIHIEPCDGSCKESCASGCLLSEEDRQAIRTMTVSASV